MRSKASPVLASVSIAAVALAITIGSASAAGKPATGATTVKCTLKTTDQAPGKAKSYDFGFADCGTPLGKGLQYNTALSAVKATKVTITGAYKQYFNVGTLHGTYKFITTTTSSTANGTATIAGGTGSYAHAAGTAKLACKFTSRTRSTCTETATLTKV